MNSRQAEAVNGCIGLSALAVGMVAVVTGIATRDGRSALVTGLCLLGLAMTASLYMALGEWDALGLYGMVAAICALALFVLQTSRGETGNWWWKLAWFWCILFHGLVFANAFEIWRQSAHGKIAGILALSFVGAGIFFLVSPLR